MPTTVELNSLPLQETVRFGVRSSNPEFDYEVVRKDDRAIIRNAVVLQEQSRNGRVYTEDARKDAAELYDGLPLYVNHGTFGDYRAQLGSLRNIRMDEGGRVRADITPNMGHPVTPQFLDDAEHNPAACALSHEIPAGGYDAEYISEEVMQINNIFKVDCVAVVTTGGVNSSLKESKMPENLNDQIRSAVEEAVKGLKSDAVGKDDMAAFSKAIAEQCGCLIKAREEEDTSQEEIAALTKERDELKAQVEDLLTKVGGFEALETKRTRTEEILAEAKELKVEVDDELLEDLLDMEPEKATKFMSRLKPAEKNVEEGVTPHSSSGSAPLNESKDQEAAVSGGSALENWSA